MEVVGVGGAIRAERNVLAQPINDPGFIDVVGRHLELHAVAGGQADEALAHFARDMGEDGVVVGQLHPEHGAGENGSDLPFEFDSFFRIHIFCGTGAPLGERRPQNQNALVSSARRLVDAAALREGALRSRSGCVLALPCR